MGHVLTERDLAELMSAVGKKIGLHRFHLAIKDSDASFADPCTFLPLHSRVIWRYPCLRFLHQMQSLVLDFTGIRLTNEFFRGVIFVASGLLSLQRLSVLLESAIGCCEHTIPIQHPRPKRLRVLDLHNLQFAQKLEFLGMSVTSLVGYKRM